ncbi:MAG: cytochrome c3 family protein [Syntrophaceae bacterium]|nr:cytochrome c3 family protein [Syntrophaceae bacterium]
MKNKWLILLVLPVLIAMIYIPLMAQSETAKTTAKTEESELTCTSCHADFATLLPQTHPPVKGTTISACMECHITEDRGKAEPDAFGARLHLAHLKGSEKADCLLCHTWKPGESFGLRGSDESLGTPSEEDMDLMKQMFTSAAESTHLDARHVAKDITCAGCHGKELPGVEGSVENERCLECHGPMEKLVAQTAPKDFPDRNPHQSHLGEIACTVCHAGHAESQVYCLQCHPKFEMKIK